MVELFGLPGAGKSTLADLIVRQAGAKTRKDLSAEWGGNSVGERLAHIGRAYADGRRLATAARFGFGARIAKPEGLFRLGRLVAKTRWLRSRSGLVLLDQGFLQDLWSIHVAANSPGGDPKVLSAFIKTIYEGIDARIVVLEVDPDTAAARIKDRTRGASRLDGLPERELRSALLKGSELQRQIVASAVLADLPVQTIDALGEPQWVADRLLAAVLAARPRSVPTPTPLRARRISIVGATGSGKSHLARQLADRLGLPLCELDKIRSDLSAPSSGNESFQRRVAELAQKDRWIIDGHYRDVRHLIWCRADLVVWLNYPLHVVAFRLLRRFNRKRVGKPPSGEQQRGGLIRTVQQASWTRRFTRIARTLRERRKYGHLLRSAEYRDLPMIELKSIEQTREWLQQI